MEESQRLLMISFDAVGDTDLGTLRALPNFSALCRRGTLVRGVSSVLVSNTYPTHTTIQTGVLPRTHGIFDNEIQEPFQKSSRWCFRANQIRVPTLTEEATRAGKTVCTILYPVTGGGKIRYNFPEIAGHVPTAKRAWRTLRFGSPGFVSGSLLRFGRRLKSFNGPDLDVFTTAVACETLEKKKPDLMMVHLLDADWTKHNCGPDSPETQDALHRLDFRLGAILQSLEFSGAADSTSVLVFSDHSCIPVHASIQPNDLLKIAGIPFTDAYFHNACGTCFLRVYRPSKASEIRAFVDKFLQTPGVERLLTAEEMHLSGADQRFAYGFSAVPGYSFGEQQLGQHGYTLDRSGYNTFYLAAGPSLPAGKELSGGSLTDICPLAVDLLGLTPWPMDGRNRVTEKLRG